MYGIIKSGKLAKIAIKTKNDPIVTWNECRFFAWIDRGTKWYMIDWPLKCSSISKIICYIASERPLFIWKDIKVTEWVYPDRRTSTIRTFFRTCEETQKMRRRTLGINQHHNIHRILTITITHIDEQQQCTVIRLGQYNGGKRTKLNYSNENQLWQ